MTIYTHIAANKAKTAALLGLFLIFVLMLAWFFGRFFEIGWLLPAAFIFASLQALVAYFFSDQITLAVSRARPASPKSHRSLHRLVENLAITAGLPKPKLYLIDEAAPNAFATGRDPAHASLVLTRGLLEQLEKKELEGVVAHELSHIGNFDIRLMTLVVVLVGIVILLSDWVLRLTFWGGRDRERSGFDVLLLVFGLLVLLLSPLIATLIQLAISRKREFLADATGALLTRYPLGLAAALAKIASAQAPLAVANRATAHLFISDPLRPRPGRSVLGWFLSLFKTHPPIEERIGRLKAMAQ